MPKRLKPSEILRRANLPVTYHDRSELENYANCPFMAWAIATKKVQDINGLAMVGQLAHKVIGETLEQRGEEYAAFSMYLREELSKVRPDLQPEVIAALRNFLKTVDTFDPWRIVSVEKQYSTVFWEATRSEGPHVITCCIDFITAGKDETSLVVWDWKSGWKRWTNTLARTAFQTHFYSFVLFKEFPQVETIHFWYDNTRYESRAYAKITREFDYHNYQARIAETIRLKMSGSKEAWPLPEKCAWCPACLICPHAIEAARDFQVNPVGHLQQYRVLKSAVKKMKTTMTAYCKETGNTLWADGKPFGLKPIAKRTYDDYAESEGSDD